MYLLIDIRHGHVIIFVQSCVNGDFSRRGRIEIARFNAPIGFASGRSTCQSAMLGRARIVGVCVFVFVTHIYERAHV